MLLRAARRAMAAVVGYPNPHPRPTIPRKTMRSPAVKMRLPAQRKRKTICKQRKKVGKKNILRWAWPVLLSFLLSYLPSLSSSTEGSRLTILPTLVSQRKVRAAGVAVILEECSDRGRPWAFPPARPPSALPYQSALGLPGFASGGKVMVRLSRTTSTRFTLSF